MTQTRTEKILVKEMAATRSSGTCKVKCDSQVPRHDFCTHNRNDHKACQKQALFLIDIGPFCEVEHLTKVHISHPYSTLSYYNHPTTMTIKNVAIIGANGTLGPAVLAALNKAAHFTVTVISRKASKSKYATDQIVKYVSDDPTPDELVEVLQGQDALVATFMGTNDVYQTKLADACVVAGVKRFIPADFGSCDSSSKLALDLMPLYKAKTRVREHLQGLAKEGKLSWTAIVCGHFFDYGLKTDLLSVELKEKKMTVFGDGKYRWSSSTLDRVGLSVVRCLEREEETRNRMVYVQSFCVSQNELKKALERATGEEFEENKVDVDPYIKEMKGRTDKDSNDAIAREGLVSVVGIIDGDWTKKNGFANKALGLEDEDLDVVVKRVLADDKAYTATAY